MGVAHHDTGRGRQAKGRSWRKVGLSLRGEVCLGLEMVEDAHKSQFKENQTHRPISLFHGSGFGVLYALHLYCQSDLSVTPSDGQRYKRHTDTELSGGCGESTKGQCGECATEPVGNP
eukprot:GHVT01063644.1.p1 GENE.GHVT01063644.1~~GHVT01063644.1.p1  ORF type:complete len:118 (+),score=0.09 GHVT01063644.1:403-756(+)